MAIRLAIGAALIALVSILTVACGNDGGASEATEPYILDGMLIQSREEAATYFVEDGKKRHIINPEVFEACGYSSDYIRLFDQLIIDLIPRGSPIESASCPPFEPFPQDGSLIQSKTNPATFVTLDGRKRLISDAETLQACAYDVDDIQFFDQVILDSILDGPPVEPSNCPDLVP